MVVASTASRNGNPYAIAVRYVQNPTRNFERLGAPQVEEKLKQSRGPLWRPVSMLRRLQTILNSTPKTGMETLSLVLQPLPKTTRSAVRLEFSACLYFAREGAGFRVPSLELGA